MHDRRQADCRARLERLPRQYNPEADDIVPVFCFKCPGAPPVMTTGEKTATGADILSCNHYQDRSAQPS